MTPAANEDAQEKDASTDVIKGLKNASIDGAVES